jgi:hypothetical protein
MRLEAEQEVRTGRASASTGRASASTSQTSQTSQTSPTLQANLARLDGLAEVLIRRGLRARLVTPPGRVPSLHVVNPHLGALAEDIYVGRGQDGLWWFWWSWAERIAIGEDLEGAATMIERVLAAGQ